MSIKNAIERLRFISPQLMVYALAVVAVSTLATSLLLPSRPSGLQVFATLTTVGLLTVASACLWHGRECAVRERDEIQHSLTALEALVEASSDAIIGLDVEGRIVRWNHGARRIYGYPERAVLGHPITTLSPPDRHFEVPQLLNRVRSGLSINGHETIHERRGNLEIHVSLSISPILGARGKVLGASLVARDITERKRAEELLHRQSAAMKASMDGMAIIDHCGDIVYLNDAFAHTYGYRSPEDLVGVSWEKLYETDELSRMMTCVMPASWRDGSWRGEAVGRRRDATTFPQEISISCIRSGGLVFVVRDITDRKRAEEALQNTLLTDPLTGLYTRRGFHKRAEEHFASADASHDYLLLFMDLDGLKAVNDSFGHAEGDKLLVAAAEVLKASVSDQDIVGRLGGDEFTILVTDGAAEQALVVERIKQKTEERNGQPDAAYQLSFSIGAHRFTAEVSSSLEDVIAQADLEMYRHKQSKKRQLILEAAA
jgi:diguanylate cyclase (GGDEF)-like protein/PAS domain S-box-containing protein